MENNLFGLRDGLRGGSGVEYGSGGEGVLLLLGSFLSDSEFFDRGFMRVLEYGTMSAEIARRGGDRLTRLVRVTGLRVRLILSAIG